LAALQSRYDQARAEAVHWETALSNIRNAVAEMCLEIDQVRGDEVAGEWRKLHNEELHDLYSSPNIVQVIKLRRMRWAGHVAHMGEGRGIYRVFVGKPEGKRPLGRPRHRWEDNIKMGFQEVGYGCMEWIWLSQDTGGGHL
jgi:hypothetical protein